MEANLTLDTVKFYPFPGYKLYLLPKYRKVASGILVGIKDTLTADFEFFKEKLDEIKAKRDRLRRKAELSKRQKVIWYSERKTSGLFKKTVLEAIRKML
ncbi:hypothetical protein CEXT_324861 [Caerostris extrusa]|uniref:Uncharacterized protein n=1 Tax=Caerostris extrusa TaxID=172846 RepID=A0AAV4TW13_CAEEX|nr:hypothetical protein CEXT_324861 [Caerostris extrusa]